MNFKHQPMMDTRVPLLVICFAQILLVSYVVGSSSFKVAIVNQDAKQTGGQCRQNIMLSSCSLRNLSCRYIAYLKRQPITESYRPNLDSTLQAMRRAELDASAVIFMNENYTDAFVAKMALGDEADRETVDSGQINVWLHQGDEDASTLQQHLQAAFNQFTRDIMTICEFTQDKSRFTFNNAFLYRYI